MAKHRITSQEKELRKRFNREMEWRYARATVWENGKLVMKEGKPFGTEGEEWWKRICRKVWKTKSRYMEDLSLQPAIESYKYFKKHWIYEEIEDEENKDL